MVPEIWERAKTTPEVIDSCGLNCNGIIALKYVSPGYQNYEQQKIDNEDFMFNIVNYFYGLYFVSDFTILNVSISTISNWIIRSSIALCMQESYFSLVLLFPTHQCLNK